MNNRIRLGANQHTLSTPAAMLIRWPSSLGDTQLARVSAHVEIAPERPTQSSELLTGPSCRPARVARKLDAPEPIESERRLRHRVALNMLPSRITKHDDDDDEY